MEKVHISTPSKDYPVFIEKEAIGQLESFLKDSNREVSKILIITDYNVGDLYLSKLENSLSSFDVTHYVVPNGEEAKTFEIYYSCLSYALEQKLDRKSYILALGGGAVGDLAGFVAATYMRGIPFIQIPTTILAHDSAVGGKVAINHPLGKNMIGAFYQPEAVFFDLNFLKSLPLVEKRSGFAEVIKHGLIQDFSFYEWLNKNITSLETLTDEQISFFLKTGINIKGAIVKEDEKENGIRRFLNFGHTLGHAIEAEAGYGKISHGEAVMIGMVYALQLSKAVTNLSFNMDHFKGWLSELGYQITVPSYLDPKKLLARMKQDKKSIKQKVTFVLLEEIGQPMIKELCDELILEELEHLYTYSG
ncbi:3-dehydroquinate synthase (plasmid) [Bacillus sp. 31A1R]|uniref:3-dehydroquinate synthase n=1 Tax=Robertmurraya mangrovi TaxID=3098077 RepID=A0ABU5IVN4_9BACI|nr:3-dehydroquinate synthase [Bacillus sp. 31A1R]MDZ5471206.1 3-dehydroquinate synthase [Bacillus sp. 31A1R]